jgi:major membrane immunogen (membrane-anchored lipoprotein)
LETYLGAGYKDLADPFAELAKALNVDVVIGATYYDSCVALVKAFSELKFYPKSLAVIYIIDS